MKIFTVEDYLTLSEEEQQAINDWLTKYQLENVTMVTSTQTSTWLEDSDAAPVLADRVAVFSQPMIKVFAEPNAEGTTEAEWHDSPSPFAYVKSAELYFDDFPWPEGY